MICVCHFFFFGDSLIVSSVKFGRDFSELDFYINNAKFIRQSMNSTMKIVDVVAFCFFFFVLVVAFCFFSLCSCCCAIRL